MNNHPLTVAQILGAIHRHKIKAFFVWLLVVVTVFAGYYFWPRQYGSEGRLYVKMDRNNTSINPSSSANQVSIQDTRETEIRSVIEIIRSRAVLDAVVDEIGADKILENNLMNRLPSISMPHFFGNSKSGELSADEYETVKKRELAVKQLLGGLDVYSEKKTSIISVDAKGSSPQQAQKIVESIFENTRRVHLEVHAVSGSAEFFDDQFAAQESKLVDAVQELANFRNEQKVLSIGAARDSLQNILSTIDQNTLDADVNLNQSKERLAKLKELMADTKAQIELPRTGVERLSYEDSRTELFKLQSEKERLTALYTPTHPDVLRVEQQVRTLRKALEEMSNNRTESLLESNPVYEAMQVDFLKAKAEVSAFEARLKSLQQKRLDAEVQLASFNDSEVKSDQLQRNVEIARQYLAIYTQKRGESKAMEMLDDRKISDVVVAQTPKLTVKHQSPKGSLILPLGCIAGLLAGLATSLYADRNHLSGTLNESEVEQVLELPVLVTLPRVYSNRNMVN
ncbi:MAG: hypothetical protein AAFN77_18535 [Planctomycetota bacterium]